MVNLRIPGPTPIPDQVLQASSQQMMNHRGPEFKEILVRTTKHLQNLFTTTDDLLILTASGTGAMEAAVVNTLSPNDKVLVISIGVFGERLTKIAQVYGADVHLLSAEYGKAVDPEDVRKILKNDQEIKTVLLTHNETSTGVTNDLESIAKIVKGEFNKLLIVDAVSSIGSIPCPVDDWNLDVVASGSQKGWMAPPGLAFISMSKMAWDASEQGTIPRFYFDLKTAKTYLEKGQNPWTPAVSVFYALDTALSMMLEEGLPNIFERHSKIAQRVRDGVKDLGLTLFADEAAASNTVTSVKAPDGIDIPKLLSILRIEHGVVLAGGQGSMQGSLFRLGHLGFCSEEDIDQCLDALKLALPKVGYKFDSEKVRG
jgi:aspartate aminotransferase-like enzyme